MYSCIPVFGSHIQFESGKCIFLFSLSFSISSILSSHSAIQTLIESANRPLDCQFSGSGEVSDFNLVILQVKQQREQ